MTDGQESVRLTMEELVRRARVASDDLDGVADRLPVSGGVAVEECVAVAARLRGLAKQFDRFAGSRQLRLVRDAVAGERAASAARHPSGSGDSGVRSGDSPA